MPETRYDIACSLFAQIKSLKESYSDEQRVVPYNKDIVEIADHHTKRSKELERELESLYKKISNKGFDAFVSAEELAEAVYNIWFIARYQNRLSELVTTYMKKDYES